MHPRQFPPSLPPIRHLFGVALDNDDGHRRLTRGAHFTIVGGASQTHHRLTEIMLRAFSELDRRGRCLEHTDPREIAELIRRCSLDN